MSSEQIKEIDSKAMLRSVSRLLGRAKNLEVQGDTNFNDDLTDVLVDLNSIVAQLEKLKEIENSIKQYEILRANKALEIEEELVKSKEEYPKIYSLLMGEVLMPSTIEGKLEKIVKIIYCLWEEKDLKHKYDYTWIMEASNQCDDMPTFDSPKSFVDFLKKNNCKNTPSEDSIEKKEPYGDFPNWEFDDCDSNETLRRINIARKFVKLYRSNQHNFR